MNVEQIKIRILSRLFLLSTQARSIILILLLFCFVKVRGSLKGIYGVRTSEGKRAPLKKKKKNWMRVEKACSVIRSTHFFFFRKSWRSVFFLLFVLLFLGFTPWNRFPNWTVSNREKLFGHVYKWPASLCPWRPRETTQPGRTFLDFRASKSANQSISCCSETPNFGFRSSKIGKCSVVKGAGRLQSFEGGLKTESKRCWKGNGKNFTMITLHDIWT